MNIPKRIHKVMDNLRKIGNTKDKKATSAKGFKLLCSVLGGVALPLTRSLIDIGYSLQTQVRLKLRMLFSL